MAVTSQRPELEAIPEEIQSPSAKLVYLYLAAAGDATVTELQRRLGLSKLTLFSVLDALAAEDLVRETDSGYTCL